MGDSGRAVVYLKADASLPEGTTGQGSSAVVVSTADSGRHLEMVMADKIVSPLLSPSEEMVVV